MDNGVQTLVWAIYYTGFEAVIKASCVGSGMGLTSTNPAPLSQEVTSSPERFNSGIIS